MAAVTPVSRPAACMCLVTGFQPMVFAGRTVDLSSFDGVFAGPARRGLSGGYHRRAGHAAGGGILSWGVAVPILTAMHPMPAGGDIVPRTRPDLWAHQVRFMGAGIIAVAAIWSLARADGANDRRRARQPAPASGVPARRSERAAAPSRDMPLRCDAGIVFGGLAAGDGGDLSWRSSRGPRRKHTRCSASGGWWSYRLRVLRAVRLPRGRGLWLHGRAGRQSSS